MTGVQVLDLGAWGRKDILGRENNVSKNLEGRKHREGQWLKPDEGRALNAGLRGIE